jgi:hypothetical protein
LAIKRGTAGYGTDVICSHLAAVRKHVVIAGWSRFVKNMMKTALKSTGASGETLTNATKLTHAP